jgi:membrane fusion protein, macrolide-specific efflux system
MKIKPVPIIAVIVVLFIFWLWNGQHKKTSKKVITQEIQVERGDIDVFITTTGTVQPQNRLEMKPPINGRVEDILVHEGDHVQKAQIVAWMSSTERAALLDAARTKDDETLKYWEEAYKPTPLIAPIDGDVIVRSVEPGQTVTSVDPIVVLSDRLIVKAQVDETDIGRVQLKQEAFLSLDAYPNEKIRATVDHISYESKLINNVTIYEVDILPEQIPSTFRSGMSANVSIIEQSKKDVLMIPSEAVKTTKHGAQVLVKENKRSKPELRAIQTGISNDSNVEVVSGLGEEETVVIEKIRNAVPRKNASGSNPFMPSMGGGRQQRNR